MKCVIIFTLLHVKHITDGLNQVHQLTLNFRRKAERDGEGLKRRREVIVDGWQKLSQSCLSEAVNSQK